ncbi:MAG: DUF4292 domain-containing protein [Gammaproteobacteria bacterium]|nr:DUF4292 domain-containing protein [Gammaproteobacteria bacterium]
MRINYNRLLISIFLSVAGALPAAASMAGEAETIVGNIVKAYGGVDALKRVKSVHHIGTIQSVRLQKTGTLSRLLVLPGKLRVEIDYPGGPKEQRITTEAGAWRDGRPATAPMHKAMTLQAARFQLPLILTRHPVTIVSKDKGQVRLKVELPDSTSLEVTVNPDNWRIVRSVGRMAMGQMNMEFGADYSDFRIVDGVLFAHREQLMAMGQPTGIAEIKKIEINRNEAKDQFSI